MIDIVAVGNIYDDDDDAFFKSVYFFLFLFLSLINCILLLPLVL